MNIVALYGRLTREPELRYSQSGIANVFFTIAVDRGMRREKRQEAESQGRPTADFISCKAFGKTAELIGNYFHKGNRIAVEGSINTGSYEKDGQKIFTTDIIINRVHFIETVSKNGEYMGSTPSEIEPQGYYSIDKKDIPF